VGVAVLHEYATALVDDSAIVRAAKDIVITSSQTESIVGFTAAGAGGTAGVAGAVGVIVLDGQSWAKTGTSVTLAAGKNVAILASDETRWWASPVAPQAASSAWASASTSSRSRSTRRRC